MKKRRSAEQIVGLLRQADVDLGKGMNVPDVCRWLGISQQTYYRWRTKYGGMDPKMAKQFQELQKENSMLKKLVADQAMDYNQRRPHGGLKWMTPAAFVAGLDDAASGAFSAAPRGVSPVGATPLPPTHHADCSPTLS